MAYKYVAWSEQADALARAFWPGPLTMVLPRIGSIPDIVTAGLETVAVRIPASFVAQELMTRTWRPIAAPSANRSTGVSPTLAEHVLADHGGRIDLVLDSGRTEIGLESTVVDLTTREPRILRPGPIMVGQLEHVLGGLRIRDYEHSGDTHRPASPGLSAVHYAPKTPAIRVDSVAELTGVRWPDRAALVLVGRDKPTTLGVDVPFEFPLGTPEIAARELYAVLRVCDSLNLDLIVVVPPPDLPEWRAIRDRLWRATQPVDDSWRHPAPPGRGLSRD
jgi:L-threonylcarbamoyladenylate synthase